MSVSKINIVLLYADIVLYNFFKLLFKLISSIKMQSSNIRYLFHNQIFKFEIQIIALTNSF